MSTIHVLKHQPAPVSVLWREYAWSPRVSVSGSKASSKAAPEGPVSLRMLRLGPLGFHLPLEVPQRLPANVDWHAAFRNHIPLSFGGNFSAPAGDSLRSPVGPSSRRLSIVFKYQSASFPL